MGSASKKPLSKRKKRSRTEIIAAIVTQAKSGQSKAEIAKKIQSNSKHLQLYLDELIRMRLIEVEDFNGKKIYFASKRGAYYLAQYDALKMLDKEKIINDW
ncbi:MAG: hypothetical protein JSV05_00485 [Candidatus Bathyarchaeota archaeon]|nr:MAG: hypothetical protein JSV05_00485 [Candidatus Bathyarchaeota archaeon]